MSLKKLDNYEIDCVAAGIPKSAKYILLAGFSLGLCKLTSYILRDSMDNRAEYEVVNHLSEQLIYQILGSGAGELILKAWEAFCEESPEAAEALIEIFTLPGLSDLEREERLSRFI